MDLTELRGKIDEVDDRILSLFLERMELSREVAEYKQKNNLPVLNRTREREILKKVMEQSGDMREYAHRFYSGIFEIGRAYQENIISDRSPLREKIETALGKATNSFPQEGSIAVCGVEGAYAQIAADRMFSRGNLMFFKSFDAVFDAVEKGLCDFGILPIENSTNGSVRSTYDLLRTRNVTIVRSLKLNVRHELLAKPGTKLSDIREVHTHEQALGQCSEFLKTLGPDVKLVPCASTALAASMASDRDSDGIAAIASHDTARLYGLEPIATNISNNENNYTRFICIAKDTVIYPGADHISLIIATAHRPGALSEVLNRFSAMEVNLLKLESSPMVGHDFEFMFFFELQATVRDPKIVTMLQSLERDCEEMDFLGNYMEV
ncbi:MAG: chorismate mutase [Lachnospiraceae bacterium]|nr:chorismate mutase [Lachnospiraceae bacterium]